MAERQTEKQEYSKTANVLDRPNRNVPELSPQGEQYLKNKEAERREEQEKLQKLQEKWNKRNQEGGKGYELSKEDLELFQKVGRARRLYREIRDEVAGIDLGHEDIKEYQNLRTLAFSEYMTLFNELVAAIKEEFN